MCPLASRPAPRLQCVMSFPRAVNNAGYCAPVEVPILSVLEKYWALHQAVTTDSIRVKMSRFAFFRVLWQ
jgi:hypothetical protein